MTVGVRLREHTVEGVASVFGRSMVLEPWHSHIVVLGPAENVYCGFAIESTGIPCDAWTSTSAICRTRCPQQGVVGLPVLDRSLVVHLCGSHYDQHRRGKDVCIPGWSGEG